MCAFAVVTFGQWGKAAEETVSSHPFWQMNSGHNGNDTWPSVFRSGQLLSTMTCTSISNTNVCIFFLNVNVLCIMCIVLRNTDINKYEIS